MADGFSRGASLQAGNPAVLDGDGRRAGVFRDEPERQRLFGAVANPAVSGVPLGQASVPGGMAYGREPSRLRAGLSADGVGRFLEAIPSLKSRTALTTVYAAGLRVSEVVLLKIADIDSQRMVIRVEQGKGGKDRYVMLSPQLLRILRTYWRLARPKRWLFPGRD